LYGASDAEGGALLFENLLYAMPDLLVQLRPEKLEVGLEVDILPYQKTGVAPLARGRIIQLNGSTRGGIKLTAARVLVEVTRVCKAECGLIFCEVSGRRCKCKALQHKQQVSQSCDLRTFGDAENSVGPDGVFTIVEDYKRLRLHLSTQPNEQHDESVMVSGSPAYDPTLGDKVEHKLQEDEASDGLYEQIGGNTVAQPDDEVDVDLDASPEALQALDRLADSIQGGDTADEEEEDTNKPKEPSTVPDVMPVDEGEDGDDDQEPQVTPEQAARLKGTKELVRKSIADADRLAEATSPGTLPIIVGPTEESTTQMED
jgi:hypothetical protein